MKHTREIKIIYEYSSTLDKKNNLEQVYDLIFEELEQTQGVFSFKFQKNENNRQK